VQRNLTVNLEGYLLKVIAKDMLTIKNHLGIFSVDIVLLKGLWLIPLK
jgi:hypothetical protein